MKQLLLGLLALLMAGCTPEKLVEEMAPRDDQRLARVAIDDLLAGRSDALAAKMPEDLRGSAASVVPRMRAMVPPNPTIRLVEANWSKTVTANDPSNRQTRLVYEMRGGGKYALAEIIVQRNANTALIAGFHIQPTAGPVDSWSGLSLKDKSAAHYAILAAAIAAIGVTIAALVRIWRSGLFKRRWLWTIGALLGVTKLTIDWATGEIGFMPISIQLFSASVLKAGAGPWLVGVSLPLVALWALFARKPQTSADSVA